jgi:hypothetical protein
VEAVWAEVNHSFTAQDKVRAIEAVSATLGAGQDALARTYVTSPRNRPGHRLDDRRQGDSVVATDAVGRVGVVTLPDRAKRNALTECMTSEIISAVEWLLTQDVRVVVIRSEPDMTVWSSGHEVNSMASKAPLAIASVKEQLRVLSGCQPVAAQVAAEMSAS